MFDMSTMEKRRSVCSTLSSTMGMDDSSWGEISVESVLTDHRPVKDKSSRTIKTISSSSLGSLAGHESAEIDFDDLVQSIPSSCLNDDTRLTYSQQELSMDDDVSRSSWGELDLDDLEESAVNFTRRRSTTNIKKQQRTKPRSYGKPMDDDISGLTCGGPSGRRVARRDLEDSGSELAVCLKSLYMDYCDNISNKATSYSQLPELKRHQTC
ncbi:expressed unknown protein [Seminavis robusta]|uniref:Uncharacterized protein n=1 Tax=Seminavis robusta TaxID=568900 RepID=A0A9N8DD04_9STRA|nr:expressed unknown protein [Seminavis robusta]|eukprot:Sro67_g037480.1 n/a (211) ;mRNA; f:34737-35369